MAKLNLLCPIAHVSCSDCALYRGRHYFLPFCKLSAKRVGSRKEAVKPEQLFEAFDTLMEPWRAEKSTATAKRPIRLKVIDMETSEFRYAELEELRTRDWDNVQMMRLVDGRQITSWEKLAEIVRFMAEEGHEEVELYEAPRFMLLAGG
jgi:hypothetical protein